MGGSQVLGSRIERTQRLPTDSVVSDEEYSVQWSEFGLPRNNNEFEGSPGSNIFRRVYHRFI